MRRRGKMREDRVGRRGHVMPVGDIGLKHNMRMPATNPLGNPIYNQLSASSCHLDYDARTHARTHAYTHTHTHTHTLSLTHNLSHKLTHSPTDKHTQKNIHRRHLNTCHTAIKLTTLFLLTLSLPPLPSLSLSLLPPSLSLSPSYRSAPSPPFRLAS